MNIRKKILCVELILLSLMTALNITTLKKRDSDIKKSTIEFEQENPDLINLYKQYIKKISIYYKEKYDNPIDIYNEFSFMYKKGFLSYGDERFKVGDPVLDIHPYGGIDVVNGIGCCRNVNCLFTDILKEIGYDCGNMYGTLNDKNEFDIFANHVVTWINIDDNIYLLDPYNKIILKKNDLIYIDDNNYFIPSVILNNTYDEEYKFDVDESIELEQPQYIINSEKIKSFVEFETDELEEIEKQMVLKINNTLQN